MIITDVKMPFMDGHALVARIKEAVGTWFSPSFRIENITQSLLLSIVSDKQKKQQSE
ncbi:hypothetical protein, partial [Enterococcus innesii]|uniref:hypothetical protein n=1 Tax=Enterococcus innesii TaxID=2839759 RepID=UPI0034A2869B